VLGLIAVQGSAALDSFDNHWRDPAVVAFRDKVGMTLDAEVDQAYPARWIGKVQVEMQDGSTFDGRVDEPKGDPGNTLDRAELEDKAIRLARYHDGATEAEMRGVIDRVWTLADAPSVPRFLT
jgi:2-methylcitrate dehydratase PrpD